MSTAVAIGVFDGVHRGHQTVLRALVDEAESRHLTPAVLTFDPHPLAVVAPERAPKLLSTVGQRIERFAQLGVEITGVLPFDVIRRLAPDVFAVDVLGARLTARQVTVGEDFRYGVDRRGDVDSLEAAGKVAGYRLDVVPLLDDDDAPVSSSRIRQALSAGDVGTARDLLGRAYELRGIVVEGDGRGRTIGVPTANLAVGKHLAVPANGVYAARVLVGETSHPAVVNVGFRPTFGGESVTVEAHLLDGDHELYGRQLGVEFDARLRNERRFDGVDDLLAQIRRDIALAAELLGHR